MAKSIAEGVRELHALAENLKNEVPKHAVKACATAFKHDVKGKITTHHFKNFGGTGKSNVGTGVHFKLSGSGGGATATATPYGPFGILETGAKKHVILPVAGRGVVGNRTKGQIGPSLGRARTRRGAQGMVERRLAKGKAFKSLEGRSAGVLKQHALKFGNQYAPYVKHPGTRAQHPWVKALAGFEAKSPQIFERSVLIGISRTIR